MATAKWSATGTRTSITLSSVNSLANGSSSGLMTYDNSTDGHLYALVEVALGSFTSTTGASITLRVYPTANAGAVIPDDTASVGGGEPYTQPITVGASAKVAIFKISLIAKVSLRLQLTNNGGAAFAGSSNSINVTGFSEDVS